MRVIVRLRPPVSWRRRSGPLGPLSKAERLRRLGNAALSTPYYSGALRAGRILGAGALEDLPELPLRELLDLRRAFVNPKSSCVPANFRSPLPVSLRTAVVGIILQNTPSVKCFAASKWQALDGRNIQLLGATVPVLRRMVAGVLSGSFGLPSLSHGIVIFNSVEHGTLYPGEREILWQVFGVPLFEQWLGLDGEVMASECDAHDGMHIEDEAIGLENADGGELVLTSFCSLRTPTLRLHTGLIAETLVQECRCGLATPRLQDLRPISWGLKLQHQSFQGHCPPADCSQTETMAAGAA